MVETYRRRKSIRAELPLDVLMMHILSKLPAKHLLRFMSVSKQWKSFLKSTVFANIHLRNVRNDHHQNHLKYVVTLREKPFTFSTIDCEAPDDGFTSDRPLPFEISHEKRFSVIASCNGLLCIGILESRHSSEYVDFILWNPATGDYKILSKANHSKTRYYQIFDGPFVLYYNCFDEDYNLVRLTNYPTYDIYSLKNDSWKKVVNSTSFKLYMGANYSTWSNGDILYILQEKWTVSDPLICSITKLDIKTGKFIERTTQLFEINTSRSKCLIFTGERGCINLCFMVDIDSREWCIESWRMDGSGNWKKVSSYCLELYSSLTFLQPMHLMRNGSLFMRHMISDDVYMRDTEKHICKDLSSNGMYIPTCGKYMETLVSPNQYVK